MRRRLRANTPRRSMREAKPLVQNMHLDILSKMRSMGACARGTTGKAMDRVVNAYVSRSRHVRWSIVLQQPPRLDPKPLSDSGDVVDGHIPLRPLNRTEV